MRALTSQSQAPRPRPAAGLVAVLLGAAALIACDPTGGPPQHGADGGIAACVEQAPAPRTLPPGERAKVEAELDDRDRLIVPADACDRGDYFIEVAEGAPTPCEGFAERVDAALEARLSEVLCNYLGSTDEEADRSFRERENADGQQGPRGRAFSPTRFCATACEETGNPDSKGWGKRDTASFEVTLEPVFAPGPESLPLPEGAERRFYRVRLAATDGVSPQAITMPDASVCSYLEDIRAAVQASLEACGAPVGGAPAECAPPPETSIRIGRECRFPGAGYAATAEMLGWHLDRLGAVRVPEGAAPRAGAPRIALIDTGVEAGVTVSGRLLPDATPDSAAPTHPHGSLMAALMLQVFPAADITSIRALGAGDSPQGFGTTADLARAIWRGLSSTAPDRDPVVPLVMSLSVGWPEVLSRPRRVRGLRRVVSPDTGLWTIDAANGVCEVVEDGPGEAVRYALAAARHAAEMREDQPVSAFAAAGNRSHALRGEAAATAAALGHLDCAAADNDPRLQAAWCDGDTPLPEAPLFLPALWGFEGARVNPWHPEQCVPPTRIVEPVAAVDSRDLPSVADPEVPQAPLVAPGEQVYAGHRGLRLGLAPIGGLCDAAPLRNRRQPLALSGTSVSTALTSGLAAAVQSRAMGLDQPPFGSEALARFLYVTGVAVAGTDGVSAERASLEGMPVRRPNLCRALTVLGNACGAAVSACARELQAGGPALGDPVELAACAQLADACVAEAGGCQDAPAGPLGLIGNYPPAAAGTRAQCPKATFSGDVLAGWTPTGPAPLLVPGERPETVLSTAAAGLVGPQPPIPVCPDCLFTYTAADKKIALVVDVSTKVPAGAVITKPRVVVYDTRFPGTTRGSQTLDLTSSAFTMTPSITTNPWKAGMRITVSGPAPVGTGQLSALAEDWRRYMKAELVCNVSGSSQITSPVDVSVLRLQVP